MPDREQKGGIARFLRRLLQRPLPSANPEQHPSLFVYDLLRGRGLLHLVE